MSNRNCLTITVQHLVLLFSVLN